MDRDARYVYFIRAGERYYKVGIANDVINRLAGLQTSNPMKLELMHAIRTLDAANQERQLHNFLSDYRTPANNEWFELDPSKALEVIGIMTQLIFFDKPIFSDKPVSSQLTLGSSPDPLIEEATRIILERGSASTSFLQRKLFIGYARAARLMDELEKANIVTARDGARAREVLLVEDEDAYDGPLLEEA